MDNIAKRNLVVLVTIINSVVFAGQIFFIFFGIAVTGIKSNAELLFPLLVIVVSFIWLSVFTKKALSHCEEPNYPAVAIAAFAWPSLMVAFFAVVILLNFLGIKF